MAAIVMKYPLFRIGTSASFETSTGKLKQRVRAVTINSRVEILDKTACGSSARNRIPGLKDGSMTVEFIQDYADNIVDEIVSSKLGLDSSNCWIEVRPTTAIRSANNPGYAAWYLLESFNPASGGVGDLGMCTANLVASSVISRKTSS